MRLARTAFLFSILAGSQIFGQGLVWDSSGDGLLSGTYYFREVIWSISAGDEYALYGTIAFTGSGSYTINGTYLDVGEGGLSTGTVTGTYAIGAGGFGYLTSPLYSGVQIRGTVANGVFIGSSTEGGINDLFVAGQIPASSPTASSFSGSYSMAYMNYPSPVDGDLYDAQFTMNPNGSGTVSTSGISGYYLGNGTTLTTQNSNSVKYTVSNGAVVINFPTFNQNSTPLLSGQEYLYFSPDGNFVFGGSPDQADIFVGVKTGGSGLQLSSKLFYNAGAYADSASDDLDTYYGALSNNNGAVILHNRTFSAGFGSAFDSVTTGTLPTTSGATYSDPYYDYTIGSGGNYRIGFGLSATPGIDIALAAPAFTGTGVYLNPTGVLNAASYAPFTAGVSPGELLVLTGSDLAPNATIGAADIAQTAAFPTKLNGVQVLIDGIAAPLYYVSATQIAAIVPYAASQFSFATIQVNNNGLASKAVTEFVNPGTPGVFTNPADGIGVAAALHADYSLITANSPAEPGENISVYLTGLGQVFPPITDGSPGSSTSLNYTVNTIAANLDDATTGTSVAATVGYAGLAPGYAGLYQLNLTVPTGLTAGDPIFLEVDVLNSAGNPTQVSEEALLPIGSGGLAAVSPVRPEIQNGQTYQLTKHRNTKPLQTHIVVKPVQP
jgi:uncharacterized protein (TIGR03437 family)